MEHTLRCNALKCRAELNGHAVVTTCSHIFCIGCASRLKLSNPPEGQRPVCPACDTHLNNPDDAVITNLIPTEDYKTSVLSGLSPNLIMECAGRALSFWAYQTTQEIVYQEFLAKSLTDKYSSLNLQMDKIIHDANAEISDLRAKMNGMVVDQDNLRRKNEELTQAFREKSRKNLQTQELYDKLKRQAMLGQVKSAASDAVDHTIQASAVSNRFVDPEIDERQRQQKAPLFTDLHTKTKERSQFRNEDGAVPTMPPPAARSGFNDVWNGFSGHGSNYQDDSSVTMSSHRQRLAGGGFTVMALPGVSTGRTASAPVPQQRGVLTRQPFTTPSPNRPGNFAFAGYGMSAGVKVSHPQAVVQSPVPRGRPTIRPRVAQRPDIESFMSGHAPAFGPSSGANSFSQANGY